MLGAAYLSIDRLGLRGIGQSERPLSSVVRRTTLTITVTERGNLESTKTVDGSCEVMGHQIKIIELVPEGTNVKEGQVVCRFDSSEIDKNIAQQQIKAKQAEAKIFTSEQEVEIAKNKGEEEITAARVEHELAVLTLEKYSKSDFPSEVDDLKGNIAQQASKADEASDKLVQMRDLVRKGFRTTEQLRSAQQEFDQFDFFLKRDQQKLEGKQLFEKRLKETEFRSKAQQAEGKIQRATATARASTSKAVSEYEAAKATFELEQTQLDEYLKQKEKTVIKAAQDGVVAYANEPWYDSSRQIREGAMVYFRQKIFSLPDMSQMQVKVSVHESLVKKVKAGQKAEIRIDAFPNIVLRGTVQNVAQIADSNQSYLSGGAKAYATLVTIDAMPEDDLRPGMTAEVKILVKTLDNALVVPVQCVVSHKGEHFVYVDTGEAILRRPVKIGDTNEKLVEVLEGVKEGELVAQDAQARANVDFKMEGDGDDAKAAAPGSGSVPAPAPAS